MWGGGGPWRGGPVRGLTGCLDKQVLGTTPCWVRSMLMQRAHPSSYSWSMRTSDPALSSSSSAMEGLKSSCTRWTLLGPGGGPLGRPAAMAPAALAATAAPAVPAIIGVPIAGDEGTSSVQAGLAGTPSALLMLGGAGNSCSDMGTLDIAEATATASTSGTGAGRGLTRASRSVLGAAEC